MIMMMLNSCSLYPIDILRIGCINSIYINYAPINEMLKVEENLTKEYNERKAINSKLIDEFLQNYNK